MGGLEQTPPASNGTPGFLPALTHFTDAVDQFPKELIRHFSMVREVEAKLYDPEHALKALLDEIAKQPVTTIAQRRATAQIQATGGDHSAAASVNGSIIQDATTRHQQLSADLFPPEFDSLPPEEQADLKKRRLFFQLRVVIASMLPVLDEKLVVLNAARDVKDKGLDRLQNAYSQLGGEFSDEARYGSLTHWAYADKEEKKKGGAERVRREVASANNLAAAAQHVHDVDSIAAKSEARREAMLANKRSRHNQHVDSDFDERPVKKTHKRKAAAAETANADARGVGLGITSNGIPPQGKRKKTEKALAAAAAAAVSTAAPPMERSLSGALQAASGGRSGTSPRATPGAENGNTKRKPRAAPAPAQRKRNALPPYSPILASSPLASSFAISKAAGANAERPVSSRARKNSIANSVASAAQEPSIGRRPSSSHSIPQPNSSNVIAELGQAAGIVRDNNSVKGASTPKEPVEEATPFNPSNVKHEEPEPQEPEPMEIEVPPPAPATSTRVGRTSKTATPIVGTFPDVPMVRSRSTRNANNGNSQTSSENNSTTTGAVSKRGGHKKNAHSTTKAALPSPALKASKDTTKPGPPSSGASSPAPEYSDAGEEDVDEARYCYCNEVSYGDMIACDNDSCPREWFHLACVNMKQAPNARTKWFCSDECKEAYARTTGKSKGGRPGSSRQ
jgi:hypothetical protein